jgi:hypothetical protein
MKGQREQMTEVALNQPVPTPNTGSPSPKPTVRAASAEDFLARSFRVKEPLVEGLVHRRDLVAFGARRRNGKTTFLTNLAVPMASGAEEFLGYKIPQRRRTLLLILEDDPGEYQNFLRRIAEGRDLGGRVLVLTRECFHEANIRIDAGDKGFQDTVRENAISHAADLVVVDNLAHVIGAEYSDPTKIHKAMSFFYRLAADADSAVIIAAHPRKESAEETIRLEDDKNHFFESIMGSSHFINTTGSLWGLERRDEIAVFVGGRQRSEGADATSYIERRDDGWFHLVDDVAHHIKTVLNTQVRRDAWALLPPAGTSFGYTEGGALVKPKMRSGSTFYEWMSLCQRLKVVVAAPDGKWMKAPGV